MRKQWTEQERNERISQWANENNVELLEETAKFDSNKSPIYYKWLESELVGLVGKTNFDSIVEKRKPTVNGLTEDSKQKRAKMRFSEYGLQLQEPYRGFNTAHIVKVMNGTYEGYYGETSLATVNQKRTRGKHTELTISILTDDEKKRYFTEYAKSRGYTIIDFPEKLAVRGKCRLRSPQGNEWETVWYYFAYQENCNCPQDVKRSIGERMVSALLKANDIPFEEQKKVIITDKKYFFDFYLPSYNLVIEYNGKQHYENTGGYHKNTLEVIQQRDRIKEAWCETNKVKLVVLDYQQNSVGDIAEVLKVHLPIKVTDTVVTYVDEVTPEEIIEFYKKHSGEETSQQFDITKRKLGLICKRAGFNKRKYHKGA